MLSLHSSLLRDSKEEEVGKIWKKKVQADKKKKKTRIQNRINGEKKEMSMIQINLMIGK